MAEKKPTILVTIEGGCLLSVFCTHTAHVKVIDYDNAEAEGRPSAEKLEQRAKHFIKGMDMKSVW